MGSKTEERVVVVAQVTRCPVQTCKSTERDPYFNVRVIPIGGVDDDGNEYDTVVWRRTKCRNCGQVRDDKSFEMRGKPI